EKRVSAGSTTSNRDDRPMPGAKPPVAVDGFADRAAQTNALASEGFAGVAAVVKPPEGLAAAGSGPPPKVEGFGGGAAAGTAPPVEGFGDNTDSHGLGGSGAGLLDQEEERVSPRKRVAEDSSPETREAAENADARAQRVDLEPGWEEANSNTESGSHENLDRGEEPGDASRLAETAQTRLVPYNTLFDGRHRFTAQLQAHGYGGFHEWRMQLMKQLMENRI
ncbi:MAG: hypothetical protein H7838_13700, partial [Magnetococcus sp. DMHC-8]